MICCCTLAGTSACERCDNRYTGKNYNEYSAVISVPYIKYKTMEQQELDEIKHAIKRLNDRIDEILEDLKGEKNEKLE